MMREELEEKNRRIVQQRLTREHVHEAAVVRAETKVDRLTLWVENMKKKIKKKAGK